MTKAQIRIPKNVGDSLVRRGSEPVILIGGERWITLVPLNVEDRRLWEFSLDTGRILATK